MESLDNPEAFIPDYTSFIGDKQLVKRGKQLFDKLSLNPCSSIQRIASSKKEQKAYYRFLNNERVEEEELTNKASCRLKCFVEGRHVLCIQDTCEVNLSSHQGRLKPDRGFGRSDMSHCFKLHPGMVLDADGLTPLGFSDIKLFYGEESMPTKDQRNYQSQPVEEKESYKWIEVCQNSQPVLEQARQTSAVTCWGYWIFSSTPL